MLCAYIPLHFRLRLQGKGELELRGFHVVAGRDGLPLEAAALEELRRAGDIPEDTIRCLADAFTALYSLEEPPTGPRAVLPKPPRWDHALVRRRFGKKTLPGLFEVFIPRKDDWNLFMYDDYREYTQWVENSVNEEFARDWTRWKGPIPVRALWGRAVDPWTIWDLRRWGRGGRLSLSRVEVPPDADVGTLLLYALYPGLGLPVWGVEKLWQTLQKLRKRLDAGYRGEKSKAKALQEIQSTARALARRRPGEADLLTQRLAWARAHLATLALVDARPWIEKALDGLSEEERRLWDALNGPNPLCSWAAPMAVAPELLLFFLRWVEGADEALGRVLAQEEWDELVELWRRFLMATAICEVYDYYQRLEERQLRGKWDDARKDFKVGKFEFEEGEEDDEEKDEEEARWWTRIVGREDERVRDPTHRRALDELQRETRGRHKIFKVLKPERQALPRALGAWRERLEGAVEALIERGHLRDALVLETVVQVVRERPEIGTDISEILREAHRRLQREFKTKDSLRKAWERARRRAREIVAMKNPDSSPDDSG